MWKEIFDKQDSIFWKHTSMFFPCYKISSTKHEYCDKIMHKIVQNCKGMTFHLAQQHIGDLTLCLYWQNLPLQK